MENRTSINELNSFLQGNYMAIHEYERYIQHVGDSHVKHALQQIQKNHKDHAARIAERIQNLGGEPVNDVGFMGAIAESINKLKDTPNDPQFIVTDAYNGESKGIQMSEEIVRGDLDPESMKLVASILDENRGHLDLLNDLRH